MRRQRCFKSQGRSTGGLTPPPASRSPLASIENSVASQSSSSGLGGRSPWTPKSSTVLTRPTPKNCCQ